MDQPFPKSPKVLLGPQDLRRHLAGVIGMLGLRLRGSGLRDMPVLAQVASSFHLGSGCQPGHGQRIKGLGDFGGSQEKH